MSVGESKSPLDGSRFKALSKDYKKQKQADGAPGTPNLDLKGQMLAALEYRETSTGIEIGVFGSQAPKADGHNNFSGDSLIPERRFLPGEGESFRPGIEKQVDAIIADAMGEGVTPSESLFSDVSSVSEFYDVLMDVFNVGTISEARNAVLRSPEWYNFLKESDLFDEYF